MNIYIHVEITARELDSKLLLAIRAAEKGHEVLIASGGTFNLLNKKGVLSPGIFHTKDLTPTREEIDRNRQLREQGYVITSIDEEGGLVDFDYEQFAKLRYSDESISHASAVFCWGPNDFFMLKKLYEQHSEKFYCTGSPRADLWRQEFSPYWGKAPDAPKRPYLLVSSNFSLVNYRNRFWNQITIARNGGYFERDSSQERKMYEHFSEEIILLYEFVKAIDYIADRCKAIDIVVRPHPVEHPESWKALLITRPNVHVIHSGPISPWLNNALAVMHNGCTTALEAIISGKPVISYIPFKQKYARELPNKLGRIAQTPAELLETVNYFTSTKILTSYEDGLPPKNDIVENKIRYREHELATDRIVKIWEEIGKNLPEQKNNWVLIVGMMNIRSLMMTTGKKIFKTLRVSGSPPKASDNYHTLSFNKFPPLSVEEIYRKVQYLSEHLGIKVPIEVQKIGDRAVVITMGGRS